MHQEKRLQSSSILPSLGPGKLQMQYTWLTQFTQTGHSLVQGGSSLTAILDCHWFYFYFYFFLKSRVPHSLAQQNTLSFLLFLFGCFCLWYMVYWPGHNAWRRRKKAICYFDHDTIFWTIFHWLFSSSHKNSSYHLLSLSSGPTNLTYSFPFLLRYWFQFSINCFLLKCS